MSFITFCRHIKPIFCGHTSRQYMWSRTISIGETLPDVNICETTPDNQFSIHELFKGKKGILFAVVGAFMPGCTNHIPEYLDFHDKFKNEGFETLACIAVNDPFVMDAWGSSMDPERKIHMLADPSGNFTRAMQMELDSTTLMGNIRSKRYALLIEDNVVKQINTEPDNTGLACLLCIQMYKKDGC